MKSLVKRSLFGWLSALSLLCSGCIPVPVYVDNPQQDKAEAFVVGVTTRGQVQEQLGEPFLVAERLEVEVYYGRWEMGVLVMLVYVPTGYESRDWPSYALVRYENDVLKEFDVKVQGPLEITDMVFDETETLAVSWDLFQGIEKSTEQTDPTSCRVFLAPNRIGAIFMDGQYLGYGVSAGGFFFRTVGAGEHQLQTCFNSSIEQPNAEQCPDPMAFQCLDGEDIVFHIDLQQVSRKERAEIRLERSDDLGELLSSRKVIVGQGTYYVDYSAKR